MGRQTPFTKVQIAGKTTEEVVSEVNRMQDRMVEALRVLRHSPQAVVTAKGSIVAASGDGQPVEHKASATDGLPLLTDSTQTNGLKYSALSLAAAVTGVLPIANGGTNSSTALTNGKVMIASGSKIVEGPAGTATTVLHGNAAGNPTYSGVSLANDTTANQGTTTTLLHGNAAGQPAFSGVALADFVANLGTTTTVLHGNAAGQPTYGAVSLTADVSGTLPIANGGTNGTVAAVNGAVVYSTATAYAMTAAGTSGQLLQSAGAASPVWAGDTAWTGVTYATNFADNAVGQFGGRYRKNPDGTYLLYGTFKATAGVAAGTRVFTMPTTIAKQAVFGGVYYPAAGGTATMGYFFDTNGDFKINTALLNGDAVPLVGVIFDPRT